MVGAAGRRLTDPDRGDHRPDRLHEQGDAHGRDGQRHHDGEDLHQCS
jgi:hypothetical protein